MQSTLPIPHSISDVFWLALAIILTSVFGGGGFAVVSLFLNRKKPEAEVHESQARSAKVLAESRSIELQTSISAGDAVLRMVQQLTFAQIANNKLHEEIERLENENEAYEKQIRWAKAMFRIKGIIWEDHSEG